jgi:hypothetical protein
MVFYAGFTRGSGDLGQMRYFAPPPTRPFAVSRVCPVALYLVA